MAAPRSTTVLVYIFVAVCLILLAPYFGLHLFLTEAPEPLETRGVNPSSNREISSSLDNDPPDPKPSKALSDIEELLEK